MRKRSLALAVIAAILFTGTLGVSGSALGALLGDTLSAPVISFNNGGFTSYHAASGVFTVEANPIVIQFPGGSVAWITPPEVVSIAIVLNGDGTLASGIPGDDLLVEGTLAGFSSPLLTGEVTAFGYLDSSTQANQYDFRFTPTGGSLFSFYAGGEIGVQVNSDPIPDEPTFEGDFGQDFYGEAKGPLGLIPVTGTCDVELEKTCCIPPPPPPDPGAFDCSDAKPITSLTLIWDGPNGTLVTVEDGQQFLVDNGEEVSFGVAGLGNDVDVEMAGVGSSRFHVSCSDPEMNGPEDCGQPQGNSKDNKSGLNLWIFEGMAGSQTLDCTPPDPDPSGETACRPTGGSTGDDCQGKVLEAVFEYTGAGCEIPLGNPQDGKAKCEGSTGAATAAIVPDKSSIKANPSLVGVGKTFTIRQKDGKELGSTLKLEVIGSGTQKLEIHTSCSKDLNVGDVFGSLKLVELTTTEGGTVTDDVTPVEFLEMCELPEAPAGDACETKVLGLTLRYLGGDCTVATGQDSGKAECIGGALAGDVSITITKDEDKVVADPSSGIAEGELFTIRKIEKGEVKEFGSETKFDASDGSRTQSIMYHTSCSQPIQLGDRLGAFEVFGLERKDDEPVSLGGTVEYQYTVFSPLSNTGPITVAVDDDPDVDDGDPTTVPVGDVTLAPGQMETFFLTRTLSETTTNQATATATTDGLVCEAMDTVTVEIIPPPPPPLEAFDCSDAKPISSLTLVWDGPSGTLVTVEDGQQFFVNNGQQVSFGVAGLGNDVDVDMLGVGSSRFHVSCSDPEMNGPEDCGQPQGNSKDNKSGLDLWTFAGMAGDQALVCP